MLTLTRRSLDTHYTTEEKLLKYSYTNIVFLLFLLVHLNTSTHATEVVAEFTWNGKVQKITVEDLEAEIEKLPTYRQENVNRAISDKIEFLNEFINEKLQLLNAKQNGFNDNKELLEKVEDYRHQLMVEQLTKIEVDEKVSYSEQELQNYYQEHSDDYIVAEEVRATCISIKEDEELAQEMLDQITAGTDIVDIAKKLSEENKLEGPGSGQENPGDTGFFDKDVSESWKPFIDGVFELEVGEMTEELVEVEYGDEYYYMIFRKEEFHPERQETFEEVNDQIERIIEREKKRERILEWVEEVTGKGNLRKYPDHIPESAVKTSEENDEGDSSDDNEETNEKTEKETDNE